MVDKKAMRKRLFVDKKFQVPFILTVLIALIIVIVLLSILIVYFTSQEMTGSIYNKLLVIKNTKEMFIPVVIWIGVIILVFFGGLTLYHLLKYTHRIVGPMVRFKHLLKAMGNGNLNIDLKFRKKDKLKELGDILSSTAKSLNRRINTIKENFDTISIFVKRKGLKKLTSREIKLLKDSVDTIESILKKFKTGG